MRADEETVGFGSGFTDAGTVRTMRGAAQVVHVCRRDGARVAENSGNSRRVKCKSKTSAKRNLSRYCDGFYTEG